MHIVVCTDDKGRFLRAFDNVNAARESWRATYSESTDSVTFEDVPDLTGWEVTGVFLRAGNGEVLVGTIHHNVPMNKHPTHLD